MLIYCWRTQVITIFGAMMILVVIQIHLFHLDMI